MSIFCHLRTKTTKIDKIFQESRVPRELPGRKCLARMTFGGRNTNYSVPQKTLFSPAVIHLLSIWHPHHKINAVAIYDSRCFKNRVNSMIPIDIHLLSKYSRILPVFRPFFVQNGRRLTADESPSKQVFHLLSTASAPQVGASAFTLRRPRLLPLRLTVPAAYASSCCPAV